MKTNIPLRLIPALTAVGAMLPACGEPILGDWDVTRINGEVFPITKTVSGTTSTLTSALRFEADGEVEQTLTKTVTGTSTNTKSYAAIGFWSAGKKASYAIRFHTDEIDINYACTLAAEELECDDAAGTRVLEAIPAE